MIVITSNGVFNPDSEAIIGRWCASPMVPDRCEKCWDSETLEHYKAEGYYEEENKGTIWRFGTCHRCEEQHRIKGRNIIQI